MRQLALDTATGWGSVAVGDRDEITAVIAMGGRRHAGGLVPSIEQALALSGAGYQDIDKVVVADGPGSFTGLRIGFAAAKGILAADPGKRLMTLPSLLAASHAAWLVYGGPVLAAYDALRGEVFAAQYDFGPDGLSVQMHPAIVSLEALSERVLAPPRVLVCDEVTPALDLAAVAMGVKSVDLRHLRPTSCSMLELALKGWGVTHITEPAGFEPEYGRKAEAQVRWERRHGIGLVDS
jgi:tRNA threonylcarbamoyladenosine biosynthesis protein TsaB